MAITVDRKAWRIDNQQYRIYTLNNVSSLQSVVSSAKAYNASVCFAERAHCLRAAALSTNGPCLLGIGRESVAHRGHAQPSHPPAFRFLPLLWWAKTRRKRFLRVARNGARRTLAIWEMHILGHPLHSGRCGGRRAGWQKICGAIRATRQE